MALEAKIEKLEKELEIHSPPSDALIALALSSILAGSAYKTISGEVQDPGPREPPAELVDRLIPLIGPFDDVGDEVVRSAVQRTLSDAMWMGHGERTAGVEIEHILAFVQERTDAEVMEAVEAVRTGETMQAEMERHGLSDEDYTAFVKRTGGGE